MALRHSVPAWLGDARPASVLRAVPVKRAPRTVQFRRGADMARFVENLGDSAVVNIDAAVGAGKSTVFPGEYARKKQCLLLHVFPSRLLALDTYSYVSKKSDTEGVGTAVQLLTGEEHEFPRIGVVLMGASQYVALAVRGKLASAPPHAVLLDEAHESDTYTCLVRTLALELGAQRLMMASATFGPAGTMRRETVGTVEWCSYGVRETPDTWDLQDRTKPWGYTTITKSLLVFVDSKSHADVLVRGYTELGVDAHRLSAGMSDDAFRRAMAALRNRNGHVVVLIADYTFRSGFTFDVSAVVDTARVAYIAGDANRERRVYRKAYRFEKTQAAGRAGRVTGDVVKYWSPEEPQEAKIVDLEAVEAEAAAYLFRVLGFKPVGIVALATMASVSLPEAVPLSVALNGAVTLVSYSVDGDGLVRSTTPEAVAAVASQTTLCSDGPAPSRAASAYTPTVTDSSVLMSVESLGLGTETSDVAEQLVDMYARASCNTEAGGGRFYMAAVDRAALPAAVSVFPQGLESIVDRLLGRGGTVRSDVAVAFWGSEVRNYAIVTVLDRYNALNVSVRAIEAALPQVRDLQLGRSPGMRGMLASILDERGGAISERAVMAECLGLLCDGYMELAEVDVEPAIVRELTTRYVDGFRGLPRAFEDVGSAASRISDNFVVHRASNSSGALATTPSRGVRRQSGDYVVAVPVAAWTGIRSVSYTMRDGVPGVVLTPTNFMQRITGVRQVEREAGGERRVTRRDPPDRHTAWSASSGSRSSTSRSSSEQGADWGFVSGGQGAGPWGSRSKHR